MIRLERSRRSRERCGIFENACDRDNLRLQLRARRPHRRPAARYRGAPEAADGSSPSKRPNRLQFFTGKPAFAHRDAAFCRRAESCELSEHCIAARSNVSFDDDLPVFIPPPERLRSNQGRERQRERADEERIVREARPACEQSMLPTRCSLKQGLRALRACASRASRRKERREIATGTVYFNSVVVTAGSPRQPPAIVKPQTLPCKSAADRMGEATGADCNGTLNARPRRSLQRVDQSPLAQIARMTNGNDPTSALKASAHPTRH